MYYSDISSVFRIISNVLMVVLKFIFFLRMS